MGAASDLKEAGLVEMKEGGGGADVVGTAKASDLLGVGGVPVRPNDLGTAGDGDIEATDPGVGITETSYVGGSFMEMRGRGSRGRLTRARGVHAVAPLEEFGVDAIEEIRREAEGEEDGCVG